MRTVWLASLRVHTRRYLSAALAVVVSVAFIVAIAALSSSMRAGVSAGIDAPYRSAAAVVEAPAVTRAERLVRTHDASPVGWSVQPVRSGDELVSARADVGIAATERRWQWQELTAGRFPTGAGETLVDATAAARQRIHVGDALTVGQGDLRVTLAVVGLAEAPNANARADLYVTWSQALTWRDSLYVAAVGVAGDTRDVADARPTAEYLDDLQAGLNRSVDVVSVLLLLFAAIALFVSVLVIANTFSILLAQRMRDFALLRCVGATSRQVARSVRREALAVGTLAGFVGVLVGIGLGHVVVAAVRALSDSAPLGRVSIGAAWLVGGFVVGLLVTLIASWLPTRAVLRVSPVAALRPAGQGDVRSGTGRVRILGGVLLLAAGVALLGLAISVHEALVMIAGGVGSFSGILLLGPVLVPALVRAAGAVLARVWGVEMALASANAVRNPRRTAATAASLLVGVTLTTAVLTGMATARGTVMRETDHDHPIDAALMSATPLATGLSGRAGAVPGVATATAVLGAPMKVDDRRVTVLAVPAADVLRSRDGLPRAHEIVLPGEVADGLPDTVTVTAGSTSVRLHVLIDGRFGSALVTPATLEALTASTTASTTASATYGLWVRAADGADGEDLGRALAELSPGADTVNGLVDREWVELQLDVFTGAVVGLLAISVLIALIGIGNTLGLSVVERGREHALLRALGLPRRGLRRMLAAEAVLLSVVATVLGTAIGVAFAWVGVQVLVARVFDDAPMVLPVAQLVLVVVVAAGAGLLACVVPARRAARVAPAAGLALS